ncbi:MAG TPA: endonuclease/exonuclease/phosphatase family protein, partial [Phenylobacterium sp.]
AVGLGGAVSDHLDVSAHFAPIQLWFALIGAGLMLLTPPSRVRTATKWLAAIGAPLALLLIVPDLIRPETRAPAGATPDFTLIQYNILGGRNRALEASLDWVFAQGADVIVLEEATPRVRAGIARRTGYHLSCERTFRCQSLILTKAAPISSGLPPVTVGARVPAARATIRAPGGPITIVGAHYYWPIPAGLQQEQGRRLAAIVSAYPKSRLIVSGDFNSTPWSFTRRREDAAFGLERRTKSLFSWPTFMTSRRLEIPAPFLPIDHVYAGPGFRTVSVERGPRLGSDHYPVIVRLAFARP